MVYDYTTSAPSTVLAETEAAVREADALLDAAAAGVTNPSYESVLKPLELAIARIGIGYGRGAFLAQASTDAAVRDVGQEADERLSKWRVALVFREDLYRALAALADSPNGAALEGERRHLLDVWLRDFRRAGHGQPADVRAELERLRARLVEIEVAFGRNLNEYRDFIELPRERLAGLPESVIERLSPGAQPGTLRVSLDYPELNPFLEQAHDRAARQALLEKHWSRAVAENRPLLAEAIALRQQIASLLGYPTWAHYATEVRMSGTPERVHAFYDEIRPAVATATARDLAEMGELLNADGHGVHIGPWDWRYYDHRQRNQRFGVDSDRVSEYLPLERVVEGLFAITSAVFGVRYRRVEQAQAWHPSVELYEIRDAETDELLAHCYLDLFPREGKFGHAAAFSLVLGHRAADGADVRPVNAILANFTPPAAGRPSLLQHSEVETLFHEFGHILHMSLSRTEAARFSGSEVEWDFVEAPSQIMEHWTWNANVLARFARHYRTGEPIPADLVERLVAARQLNAGIRTAVQVFYGTLDLAIHDGSAAPDFESITRSTYPVTGMVYPEGTFMLAGFGHLLGGYDAGYYGYLWAEAIGDDMFGRFERDGLLSPAVGAAYRHAILEPNGARTADDMLDEFLGRPWTTAAWMRYKGFASPEG
jgi:Zn-dependent oligopeptidase